MIDSKILSSEWVIPNKTGWGHRLKKNAPEHVRREFEQFQTLVQSHRHNIVCQDNQSTIVCEYMPCTARADSYQSEAARI